MRGPPCARVCTAHPLFRLRASGRRVRGAWPEGSEYCTSADSAHSRHTLGCRCGACRAQHRCCFRYHGPVWQKSSWGGIPRLGRRWWVGSWGGVCSTHTGDSVLVAGGTAGLGLRSWVRRPVRTLQRTLAPGAGTRGVAQLCHLTHTPRAPAEPWTGAWPGGVGQAVHGPAQVCGTCACVADCVCLPLHWHGV